MTSNYKLICVLIKELSQARKQENQEEINEIAKALADLLYDSNYDISYDELLEGFGFIKGGKVYGILK